MTDILSGAIVAAIAIAAGMVAVWCLPRLHAMMHQIKNPVLMLGVGGFILGILGVIAGPVSLFKGLDEMQQMVANQAFSTSDYFLLAVIKLAARGCCRQRLSRWANIPGSVCRGGIRVDAA